MDQLTQAIIDHEGVNRYVYQDTRGFLTIGIGRNVDTRSGRGLSENEISYLLDNDIKLCESKLVNQSFYIHQNDVRQGVFIELVFNMGYAGLMEFRRFIAAMEAKNYELAVNELKDSLWSQQVGASRVNNICYRVLNGTYPSVEA